MNKIRVAAICITALTAMTLPISVKAADTGMDQMAARTTLEFAETSASGKVTKLSSGSSNKNITNMDEWLESGRNVSVSASLDGQTQTPLYWSEGTYKNRQGKKEHVALLKADDTHTWSGNSYMLFKIENVNATVEGLTLEMGASSDGPRDYRISYSTDEGKTWKEMDTFGSSQAKIKTAGAVTALFEKKISISDRSYTTINLTEDNGYNWDCKIYDDIYVKVTVDSDYTVDGKQGLYGSSKGEWALRSVKLLEATASAQQQEVKAPEAPAQVEAYKTAAGTITVTFKKDSKAGGYEICLKKKNGIYKKVNARKVSAAKYKIRNLSAKQTYYIKVRSYQTKDGTKSYSPYSKAVTVNMKKQPLPRDLSLNKKVSLKVGDTKALKVKYSAGTGSSFVKSINYKVKDKRIATVKNGKITGRHEGSTEVTTKVVLKSGLSKTFKTKIKVTE